MKTKFFIGVLIILPFLAQIPFLNYYPYPTDSEFSDLTISHLPNALYIREMIHTYKALPLWSDTIQSGYPFFANPLSGLWYPPGWLTWILPLPLAFNLLIVLHLIMGGMGIFLYLESEGVSDFAALIGALTFELMPKLIGHYASGHITLIYSVCWTPWLLYFEKQRVQHKNGSWKIITPGIILGLIFLADVRWAVYSTLILVVFSLRYQYLATPDQWRKIFSSGKIKSYLRWFLGVAIQILSSILLAAPILLPLAQYTQLSTRGEMTSVDNLTLSLPPLGLLGMLFPDFSGDVEWLIYPGGFSLISLVTIMSLAELRKKYIFWLAIIFISMVYSLGSAIPYIEYIFRLPGINLLRVPTRILFLVFINFSLLNALVVEAAFSYKISWRKNIPLFSVILFFVFLSIGLSFITQKVSLVLIWGAVSTTGFYIFLLIWERWKIKPLIGAIVFYLLMVMDLGFIGFSQLTYRTPEDVFSEGNSAAKYLSTLPGIFRIYSPSYSIPQQTAAAYNLNLADGVDPMQLDSYVNYMSEATGVDQRGYSVTIPPFRTGNPKTDNINSIPDAKKLGLLNVRYITAAFEMSVPGFVLLEKFDDVYIYENLFAKSRAWFQDAESDLGENSIEILVEKGIDKISMTVDGTGMLILSEMDFPGWQVLVDGQKTQKAKVENLFLGVMIPEGKHRVEFIFQPMLLYIGLGLSLIITIIFGISMRKGY